MEKLFENYPNLEIDATKILKMKKKKWKWTFKNACFKKNVDLMVETHFFGFFFVLTITEKLIVTIFKWCIIFFVTIVMSMHIIPKL
jgi:hypothetical protein